MSYEYVAIVESVVPIAYEFWNNSVGDVLFLDDEKQTFPQQMHSRAVAERVAICLANDVFNLLLIRFIFVNFIYLSQNMNSQVCVQVSQCVCSHVTA